jgi:hypothetical protein
VRDGCERDRRGVTDGCWRDRRQWDTVQPNTVQSSTGESKVGQWRVGHSSPMQCSYQHTLISVTGLLLLRIEGQGLLHLRHRLT